MRSLVTAAARLNFAMRLSDGASAPRARDRGAHLSGDPSAARVLLLGNGPATGWGVISHQLGLTGALGRRLTEGLGRAVDVDYVGDETMNLAACLPWLGDRPLTGYASILVVLGMSDAMRRTPIRRWEADLQGLLDALEARTHPSVRLVVAGIQPVRSVVPFDTLFGTLGQRHADLLNTRTQGLLASRPRAVWMPMPAPAPDPSRPLGSSATYTDWADHLASGVLPGLRSAADEVRTGEPIADPRDALPAALRAIVDDPASRTDLDALAQQAKRRFGVDAAMITLVTGEQQFFAASTTLMPSSVPRPLTYCDAVVAEDAPLVVPDRMKDPRFKDNPYLELTHLPFYAGVPLHDEAGAAIGTFCLFSATPKSADHVDLAALTELGREVEAALRDGDAPAALDPAVLDPAEVTLTA